MKKINPFALLMIIAAFAAGYFLPGCACAEDVVFFGKSSGGDFYYDRESIHRLDNGKFHVWVNLVFSKEAIESMGGIFPEIKDRMYRDVILYEVDCMNRSYKIRQYAMYDKSGKIIKRGASENPRENYFVPDTVYDTLRKAVCR